MQMKDQGLPRVLIALLVLNVALLAGLALDMISATHSVRAQWLLIGSCGFACVVAARAVKLSSDMANRLSRLSQIDRLISD